MPNNLIRCGLHLEIQKYGKQTDLTRPELKDQLESDVVAQDATLRGISRVGIDLAFAENRALFAVQRLFDETDYKGNTKPTIAGTAYQFGGDLPRLEVPVAKYLHAYGVKQKQTKRGKQEFNARAREAALQALRSLKQSEFLMAYERRYSAGSNGRLKNQHIEVIAPLIGLTEADGKVFITPNPIMVDQIDSYFVWKPADLYDNPLDGKDKTKAMFVEYLLYLYEMNRRGGKDAVFEVRRQMEVIAYALRMDSLLEARQTARIRNRLTDLYKYAVEIGYLVKYEIDVQGTRTGEIDRLHLNNDTFKKMRNGLPPTVAMSTPNGSKVYL